MEGWCVALWFVLLPCVSTYNSEQVKYSVVAGADPNPPSEIKIVKDHCTTLVNISSHFPFCYEAWNCTLYGSSIVLVTTGVGAERASTCMLNILATVQVKEVVFLGTAGISALPNGILTPNCDVNTVDQPHSIGDVCVSSAAINWGCTLCLWNSTNPSACQSPDCSLPPKQCMFNSLSQTLQQETMHALSSPSFHWPTANRTLLTLAQRYWSVLSSATGRQYTYPTTPRAMGNGNCAEATSWVYWKGFAYERYCLAAVKHLYNTRDETDSLQAQDNETISSNPPENLQNSSRSSKYSLHSPSNSHSNSQLSSQSSNPRSNSRSNSTVNSAISCVSAMEGTGWMMTLANPRVPNVPYVNIRGGSDYVSGPLLRRKDGVWVDDYMWASKHDLDEFDMLGYDYAKRTTSAVVLQLFKSRHRHP